MFMMFPGAGGAAAVAVFRDWVPRVGISVTIILLGLAWLCTPLWLIGAIPVGIGTGVLMWLFR